MGKKGEEKDLDDSRKEKKLEKYVLVLWKQERKISVIDCEDIKITQGKKSRVIEGKYEKRWYAIDILTSSDDPAYLDTLEYDELGQPWEGNEEIETEEEETETEIGKDPKTRKTKQKKKKTPKAKKRKNKEQIAKEIARINQNRLRNNDLEKDPGLFNMDIPGVTSVLLPEEDKRIEELENQDNQLPTTSGTAVGSNNSEKSVIQSKPEPNATKWKQPKVSDYFAKTKPKINILRIDPICPKIDLRTKVAAQASNSGKSDPPDAESSEVIINADDTDGATSFLPKIPSVPSGSNDIVETPFAVVDLKCPPNPKRKLDLKTPASSRKQLRTDVNWAEESEEDTDTNSKAKKRRRYLSPSDDSSREENVSKDQLAAVRTKGKSKKKTPHRRQTGESHNHDSSRAGMISHAKWLASSEASDMMYKVVTHRPTWTKLYSFFTTTFLEVVQNPNVELAALPIDDKLSKYEGNALLKEVDVNTLDSLVNRHKHEPAKLVALLFRQYYKNEETIASLSISGTGSKHVKHRIPKEVIEGIQRTVPKLHYSVVRTTITALCHKARIKLYCKDGPSIIDKSKGQRSSKIFKRIQKPAQESDSDDEEDEEEKERKDKKASAKKIHSRRSNSEEEDFEDSE